MADCIIRFTGLCAFVPNKPLDQTPETMCAVLVDGRNLAGAQKALDGTELRRHRGFVLFDLRNLPSGYNGSKRHDGVWYMERQQIVIKTDDKTPLDTRSYKASIDTNFNIDEPNSGEETSFSWVAALTKLMPNYATIDTKCISTDMAEVPDSVLAQLFFNTGVLTAEEPALQVWSVSGALSTEFTRQPLAHEAVLTLTGVSKLTFEAKGFPGTKGGVDDKLELVPNSLGKIEITIANLCDENPLRWPRDPTPRDDDDFKWYYQLMTTAQQDAIDVKRRGAPLPTPIPERQPSSNVAGVNCFSVRVAADPLVKMP